MITALANHPFVFGLNLKNGTIPTNISRSANTVYAVVLSEQCGKLNKEGLPFYFHSVLRIRIRNRCLFDPWIRDRFFTDLGSQTHIFESLMTVFG
jgi:hypothetical protein